MTVTLHGVCHYRANSPTWSDKWSDDDYKALKLVKAVKGSDFNGYADFVVDKKRYRVENTANGRNFAFAYSGWKIATLIDANGCNNTAIMPIPASAHIDPTAPFNGRTLAENVGRCIQQLDVRPELYFSEVMPKSAQGGGRNPQILLSKLRAQNLDGIKTAILLDDVYTSGAHMKAATWFLRSAGIKVEHMFVLARTAWDKPDNMFEVASEEICFL